MRLSQRLLLGAVLVVTVLVVVAVALSGQRLREQLRQLTVEQLTREARVLARQWTPAVDPEALASAAKADLGHRVTFIDSAGRVLGDSEFDGAALLALENHGARPEVVEARAEGIGFAERISPSEGLEELYVAVPAGGGRIARVSIGTGQLHVIVRRARRDLLVSGLFALLIALALAAVFSRQVTAPITELRDVTTAIAGGDLARRPSLSAPGEVGELASAVRRMAEQLETRLVALQTEDDLLGALIESLSEGVVAVDVQRRIIRINRSGRELLCVDEPVPFPATLLPRDRILQEALSDALEGRIVANSETQIHGHTLALTARPLGVGGAVLALFDLTGMRRLQTVRRDFVANVSHELKTPLTAIRGYAETLASELPGTGQHGQFAETIRANAERMQRLVDDLLDLSRIESGGWSPAPAQIPLAAAIVDIVAPYREQSDRRRLTFAIDVADDITLEAEPMALRQLLVNLLDNAVRHTTDGGIISAFSRKEDGGVAIDVTDTGSGIAPEHLPRIFERFYRVDPARSRAAGGTGLGLAIVKHLVEAHGGNVTANSTVGRGTTVSVWFPRSS